MEENKVCGNCEYHHCSNVTNEWFCANGESENYTDYTEYSDTCEEWEEREE